MTRRVAGDPSVPPWEGSEDQRRIAAARQTHHEWEQRARAARVAAADFSAPGAGTPGVRRLAGLNVDYPGTGLPQLAEQLNADGFRTPAGDAWTYMEVSEFIRLLWPAAGYAGWDDEAHGVYPGYVGPLRDTPQFRVVGGDDDRIGRSTSQGYCQRCGAQWPSGWPGTRTDDSESGYACPDCGGPGVGFRISARAHSVIDLQWMLHAHAPIPPGPCPDCGAARALFACGAPGTTIRILTWHCTEPAEPSPAHHAAASEPVRWQSPADADAYWLALDLLRVAEAEGEVTELPVDAVYESLDGDGAVWVYEGPDSGFRLRDTTD